MSIVDESKTPCVNIDELNAEELRFEGNMLKNLSREEDWGDDNGFTDYSYLIEKVNRKYNARTIVVVDKISAPGKTIYGLGFRFDTKQDKLAFILKFS